MNMQPPLQRTANQLSDYGRFGDSTLVHMNPAEVRGLASMSPTGELSINPVTGQPEAFLPFLAPILGGVLGTTALGSTLGAGLAGAIGSGIGTWIESGSLEKGIISGVTGFGLGKILGGSADTIPNVAKELANVDAAQGLASQATTDFAQAGVDLGAQTAPDMGSMMLGGNPVPFSGTSLPRVGGTLPFSAEQVGYLDAANQMQGARNLVGSNLANVDAARAAVTPGQRVEAMFSGEGLAGMGRQLKNPAAAIPLGSRNPRTKSRSHV